MELLNTDDDRGQVGIGTLIVFIAMVLVAAIAAGVLVNTAGFLQENAEQTGQQSQEQVSNRLNVVSGTATATSGTVDYVNLTVMRAAGSDTIDLDNVTVEVVTDTNAESMEVYAGTQTAEDSISVSNVAGSIGTDNLLDNPDDRGEIGIEFATVGGDSISALSPGDSVTIRLTTASGASTLVEVTVPNNLSGSDTIRI
jgi:flagellin-like protein